MSPSSGSTPSVRAYTNFSHWITRLIMAGYSGVGAPRHSGAAAENLLEEEVTQSNSKVRRRIRTKEKFLLIQCLQILLWSLAGLTFLFVATRCFLRFKAFRRLPVDDILIILSWTIFVANFVVWVVLSPTHYADLDGAKKNGRFIEPDEYVAWAKLRLLTSVLFYMSLWTVKISVLLFFRRLGDQIRSHRIWWWCVMNLTVSIWIICLANTGWECGTRSRQWIQGKFHLFIDATCLSRYQKTAIS